MIVYLKGELIKLKEASIVMEVSGVGYEVFVPVSVFDQLPSRGEVITIHTYHYVREDAEVLYGFVIEEALQIFKQLITVNGIGPKGALALLSTITIDELKFAVMSEDDKIISRAPGIGKKTAQRLIIDLKGKLKLDVYDEPMSTESLAGVVTDNNPKQEAIEALVSLGYPSSTAISAVKKVAHFTDVEDIIKQSLKHLAIL